MHPIVSESLMDATWQSVSASSVAQVRQLQQKCHKEQAVLAGFVNASALQLRRDATELALYAFVVICAAFRRSGARLRKVNVERILCAQEAAQTCTDALRGRGTPDADSIPELCSEPAVFNYILGAMSHDPENPIELSEDEYWQTLCLLMVVVDCLHDAQQ